MKKITIISFAVFGSLMGCSLDSIPKGALCPGSGISSDSVTVYIFQNGTEIGILEGERCPEDTPICAQFSDSHKYSGQYFCMEDCSTHYCETCGGGQLMSQCNGHCIMPGEICNSNQVCSADRCKDEHTRIVCSDDKQSTTEEECGENEKCSDGKCVNSDDTTVEPVCAVDDMKCSDDNLGTVSCNENGAWNEVELCPEGEKCDINQKKCVPEDEVVICNDGEIKCAGQPGIEGNIGYYECYDGKWSEEFVNCSEGLICSQEEQKCIDNPEPACTADDVKCVDDKTYQVCDPVTGLWTTSTGTCEDGFVCDKNENKCIHKPDAVCENGAIKCADDANYYTCVDGQWSSNTTACGEGKYCNQEHNQCEEKCEESTFKCSGDMTELFKCDNGIWKSVEKCASKQLCIASKCEDVECTPGVDFCDDTIKNPAVYKCTAEGKKGDVVDQCNDTFRCTDDGKACLICEEGAVHCTDEHVFQICENNTWIDIVDCSGKGCYIASANSNKYNGCGCNPNSSYPETLCSEDGHSVFTCTNKEYKGVPYRSWELISCGELECKKTNIYKQSISVCSCIGQYYRCVDNALYQCDNDMLKFVNVCAANETCGASKGKCLCAEGTYRCAEKTVSGKKTIVRQHCIDGIWEDKNCEQSYTCVNNGFCASTDMMCQKNNAFVCNGNTIIKCVDGAYTVSTTCDNNYLCANNGANSSCISIDSFQTCNTGMVYQQRCFGNVVQTCQNTNYQWANTETCTSGTICVEKTSGSSSNKTVAECQPKVCDNYKFSCKNDVIQICLENELRDYGDCSEIDMTCKDGACVAK